MSETKNTEQKQRKPRKPRKPDLYAKEKMDDVMVKIIDRMVALRIKKGLNRKEFCERCSVSPRTVAYWESYQRGIKGNQLPAIFRALDVTPNEFFEVGRDAEYEEFIRKIPEMDRDALLSLYQAVNSVKKAVEIALYGLDSVSNDFIYALANLKLFDSDKGGNSVSGAPPQDS